MSEVKSEMSKELNSDFIDEVSIMLEKLKEKIGKSESQPVSPLLNYNSCEDSSQSEAVALTLISKLQNTLGNIKPSSPQANISEEDSFLKNDESKIDSYESQDETLIACSEDYEANSEDSTDEDERLSVDNDSFSKEIVCKNNLVIQKDSTSSTISGNNISPSEFRKSNQNINYVNHRRHSKENVRSKMSLAIVNCKSQEHLVSNSSSTERSTPQLIDSESDEGAPFPVNKKRKDLPWKIRAAKKRIEHMNKSENYIDRVDKTPYPFSKSIEGINFSSSSVTADRTRTKYAHSKSDGNVITVLHKSPDLVFPFYLMPQTDRCPRTEVEISGNNKHILSPVPNNCPQNSYDSDGSDEEGEVFTVKPITANFLSQQEKQENKDKSRLPFEVCTNEVMKITELFNKPLNTSEPKLLDKAPRKKVYKSKNNNDQDNEEDNMLPHKNSSKLCAHKRSLCSKNPNTSSIRKFPINDKSMKGRIPDKKLDSNSINCNAIDETRKINDEFLNENSANDDNYKILKSKSTPFCFKFINNSEKVNWNINDKLFSLQDFSSKPCFTSNNGTNITNKVKDAQRKLEIQCSQTNPSDFKEISTINSPINYLSQIKDICNDPTAFLFTPEEQLKIAIHKAAINKQLSVDQDDGIHYQKCSDIISVPENKSPVETVTIERCSQISGMEPISEKLDYYDYPTILNQNQIKCDVKPGWGISKKNLLKKYSIDSSANTKFDSNLKRRCFSECGHIDKGNLSIEKGKEIIFNKSLESDLYKSNIKRVQNTIPKSYVKLDITDNSSRSSDDKSPQLYNVNYSQFTVPLINKTESVISDNESNQSFPRNITNVPTLNGFNSNANATKSICMRQQRQKSLEDHTQLLTNKINERRLIEAKMKKRSYSETGYPDKIQLTSKENDDSMLITNDKYSFVTQNIFQISAQKTDIDSQSEIIDDVYRNIPSIDLLNVNEPEIAKIESLHPLINEDQQKSIYNVNCNGVRRQLSYHDSRQTELDTKSETNSDPIEQLSHQKHTKDKTTCTPIKNETFVKSTDENLGNSNLNKKLLFFEPNISNTVMSSSKSENEILSKPPCTDSNMSSISISADKIGQLEHRSNPSSPISPTYSNSYSTCGGIGDLRDGEESEKLNKVSNTWLIATNSQNIIKTSKPWANENGKIKGEFIIKNKDKLLKRKSSKTVDESNSIRSINAISIKKGTKFENKIIENTTKPQLELREHKKNRIKDISTKYDSNLITNVEKSKVIVPTNGKAKNKQNENKSYIKSQSNFVDQADCYKLSKHFIPKKEIDSKIANVTNKVNKISNSDSNKKTINETQINEGLQLRQKLSNERRGSDKAVKKLVLKENDAEAKFNVQNKDIGPTINKLLKTNEAFKNITKQMNSDMPDNVYVQSPNTQEKRKSINLNKLSIWENKVDVNKESNSPCLWNASPSGESLVKKNKSKLEREDNGQVTISNTNKREEPISRKNKNNLAKTCLAEPIFEKNKVNAANSMGKSIVKKNKLETENGVKESEILKNILGPENCILYSKPFVKNSSSKEFKSVMSNYEKNETDTEKANHGVPLNNIPLSLGIPIGTIEKRSTQFKESPVNNDANFPLRLSKSCIFRHSSYQPFTNSNKVIGDIPEIKHEKLKDLHSVQFKKIVENLECGEPKTSNNKIPNRRKATNRNRPKSLYINPNDDKSFNSNQFSWKKEVGKLNLNQNTKSKVISDDKRKEIESFFKSSQPMANKSYQVNKLLSGSREKFVYSVKQPIKSGSGSERSSIYDSWEHLVSNTDYNSQLLDEMFSETMLQDIELSDSSISRRRFSDFSVDSNDSNSEIFVGSKLARSQTFSHMIYKKNDRNVTALNNTTRNKKIKENKTKKNSKDNTYDDHQKARNTLLKMATFDVSLTDKPGRNVNTRGGMVNQSSYVGKGASAFNKFKKLDQSNTASGNKVDSPLFALTTSLNRSASGVKDMIMTWCKGRTRNYKGVNIENFSTSWNDGLAFCALIHHFYPDAFNFEELSPKNRRYNFELAFRTAKERADVYPLLDVEDMVVMQKPDWKCVFTYVQTLYKMLKDL